MANLPAGRQVANEFWICKLCIMPAAAGYLFVEKIKIMRYAP
jgi:hypothetical protein